MKLLNDIIDSYVFWKQNGHRLPSEDERKLKRAILEELDLKKMSPETLRKKGAARLRFLNWLNGT